MASTFYLVLSDVLGFVYMDISLSFSRERGGGLFGCWTYQVVYKAIGLHASTMPVSRRFYRPRITSPFAQILIVWTRYRTLHKQVEKPQPFLYWYSEKQLCKHVLRNNRNT